ncbi:MAG: ABC transporter permease [Lachnospiraceae bacterium]|nr:ABC transporter permease [Lachnospiraceae bacterium]
MKRSKYRGLGNIYSYSLKRNLTSRRYIVATLIVSLVFILGIIACFLLVAKKAGKDNEEKKALAVNEIFVVDETGFGAAPYAEIAKAIDDDILASVKYTEKKDADALIKENKEAKAFVVIIQKEENEDKEKDKEASFVLDIIHSSDVDEEALDDLRDSFSTCFKNYLLGTSGLSEEQLVAAMAGITTTTNEFGQEEEFSGRLFAMIAIFIMTFFVYFIIAVYGQQVQADVSVEKSNKLVEQLLVSVSPEALITGKSLGLMTSCIIQIFVWILSIGIGIVGGLGLSLSLFGSNSLISSDDIAFAGSFFAHAAEEAGESGTSYFEIAKTLLAEAGITQTNLILSILLVLAGTVFYMAIATIGGSLVTKPEEAANMQSVYIMPLILSFFAILFPAIDSMGKLPKFYAYIPFTSAMYSSGAVLAGELSVAEAVISLVVLIVAIWICLVIAAKIYMSLIFFNGDKTPLLKKIKFAFGKKKTSN